MRNFCIPCLKKCASVHITAGELGEADKTVVIDMDAEVKIAPAISSSVLSVLDLNAINKFKTSPATVEDSWSLKALAPKGAF